MMRSISMRSAWSKGLSLLFGDWKTAATYLGMAIVIPFLLFSIHDGSNFRTFFALLTDWRVMTASAGTPWTILSLFLFSAIGMGSVGFAYWNAVLTPSRDGVIGEVMYGLVAGLICSIVAAVIYVLISLPAGIFQAIVQSAFGIRPEAPPTSPAAMMFLPNIVIGLLNLLFVLWFAARLSMTGPIMAAIGSLNPFPALAQSWRLTGQAQWRVFFYLLLFQVIGYMAFFAFIFGAAALIRNTYDFGWQDRLITIGWMLFELVFMGLFLIVSAGLYRELAGDTDVTVFE